MRPAFPLAQRGLPVPHGNSCCVHKSYAQRLFLVQGSNDDSNGAQRWHVPEAFADLYAPK